MRRTCVFNEGALRPPLAAETWPIELRPSADASVWRVAVLQLIARGSMRVELADADTSTSKISLD